MSEPAVIESVRFVVYGPPRPKERPRVTSRGTFTPERTKQFERAVSEVAVMYIGRSWSMQGHFRVRSLFVFPTDRHPDGDNVQKAVLDALQGIAYANDRQVMEGPWRKVVERGGRARTEITIERLNTPSGRRT